MNDIVLHVTTATTARLDPELGSPALEPWETGWFWALASVLVVSVVVGAAAARSGEGGGRFCLRPVGSDADCP